MLLGSKQNNNNKKYTENCLNIKTKLLVSHVWGPYDKYYIFFSKCLTHSLRDMLKYERTNETCPN